VSVSVLVLESCVDSGHCRFSQVGGRVAFVWTLYGLWPAFGQVLSS
jgi:hypothetical protein